MSAWLRRAGRGRLPDGSILLWSVAEGSRGRRWRTSTLQPSGEITLDLLLELDGDGRFSRLEMSGPAGMLTLHPEPAGERVDGNVVTSAGVRPISLPWGPTHELHVAGNPIPQIAASRARTAMADQVSVVVIETGLEVKEMPMGVGEGMAPAADSRAIPILEAADEWALEEELDA